MKLMTEWFEFQRQLFQRTQRELKSQLAQKSPSLKAYEASFRKDQKGFEACSKHHFLKTLNQHEVVFIGDFHSLKQAQRSVVRLLREPRLKKPDALFFELIEAEFESAIQNYAKAPSERKRKHLAKRLQLERKFGTSSEVYFEIFEEAGKRNIALKGIHSQARSLTKRDQEMASRLVKERHNQHIWVLAGEFHVARGHLPIEFQNRCPNLPLLCVQQNDDRLALQQLKALSSGRNLYFEAPSRKGISLLCWLHTPLWIKWQSFLNHHLHHVEDDPDFNAQEQIRWCLKTLLQFLDDPRYDLKTSESFFDFAVLGVEDEELPSQLRRLSASTKRQVRSQFEVSRVAYLSDRELLLLSEISFNSCAQAAAHYFVMRRMRAHQVTHWSFYQRCFFESLTYLLTKILNHSRKTKSWRELTKETDRAPQELHCVLKAREFFHSFQKRTDFERSLQPYKDVAARELGRRLSDDAFEAFLVGEFSKARLLRWLSRPWPQDEEAFERLVELQSLGRAFRRAHA